METPPPLVLFDSIDRYLKSLDVKTRTEFESEIRRLHDSNLPIVISTRCLAILFGYRPQFLAAIRRRTYRYYNRFEIRKGTKRRQIQAPRVALKLIQKWFGHHLCQAIKFPEYVVGFVPKRSTYDGALPHCGAKWLVSMDLQDFFATTSASVVEDSLGILGYSSESCRLISDLHFVSGGLAQGSPASPVLANLAMTNVDRQLDALAKSRGATYTRYADDIVFSGKSETVPADLVEIVERIFLDTCWKLAERKTRISTGNQRKKIYGLVVSGTQPRLSKGYRKRLRAIKYQKEKGVLLDGKLAEAQGHLAYANSIDRRNISPQ